ncbi:MAG: methyltransferase domain-containing protein [Candidatus Nanoarchaeia archaeon]|jgi:SAM-dependent methyltransferase
MKYYSKKFYESLKLNYESAEKIVSFILKIVNPKSVVDVGCGLGVFLNVFKKKGIKKILGIDGKYVSKDKLLFSKNEFLEHDLEKPINIKKKFDLVLSLEVAEHISNNNSDVFVESLVNLGDIIVFSSAIPYQGGTNHINEQWPIYWRKKFEKKGYVLVDCLRNKMWNDKKILFYYSQNIFFYIKKKILKKNKKIMKEFEKNKDNPLSIIHPDLFLFNSKRYYFYKKILPFLNIEFFKKILKR